jgi:hypothetical protein
MGMYTTCIGWILLNGYDMDKKKFKKIMNKAKKIGGRIDQCIYSTTFHNGFDSTQCIFIGGSIKNYNNDWNELFRFLEKNFDIQEYKIQTRYEEDDFWVEQQLNQPKTEE